MGSLDHAKTELLDFSTWKWKESSPYLEFEEIYLFATLFYHDKFYVVGGRTKTKFLSIVATFSSITEKWIQIGHLRSPRFGHRIDVADEKLVIIGGSENFEHCDLTYKLNCSIFASIKFKHEDNPILYRSYPSKCKTGDYVTNEL